MKKDIIIPKVEGVSMAVVRKINELGGEEWYVYLINENPYLLENVIISSRGYGEIAGEKRETSILRHVLGDLAADSSIMVEPIDPAVFPLNNEYWLSYYRGSEIYDKRFTFVPDSIVVQNLIPISSLKMSGVLHE